ncbi:MAG: phosphoribosylformylglycinamidine cyclo-ligase, partial [Planctomycetes bacterium]|nr:phosphoribosylformylglycinamidine cyclo-ligase [Planctomycetota bacterium]
FEKLGLGVEDRIEELGATVAEALLVPTIIYTRCVRAALSAYKVKKVVKGIAHITGGGLVENVPRVLPAGLSAKIRKGSWPVPPVFGFLQKAGDVAEDEMYRVFNMGIGMALIVSPYYAHAVAARLEKAGATVHTIGQIVATPGRRQAIIT